MLYNEHLYEDCINQIEKSAQFAWLCFSGYYRSNILENLLNTIGSEIIYKESSLIKKNTSDSFKILHVCSTLYETGGHTKLLFNWIENDQENDHSLVSTRLNEEELLGLSRFYSKKIRETNLHSVSSFSKIDSAKKLNALLGKGYNLIVLHTHPDECLINLVFSNEQLEVPVYTVNHADHVFWLGASVTDILLQIRESNIEIDKVRRQIKNQAFLPIPIQLEKLDVDSKAKDSTQNLNLLSTGSYYKYLPDKEYNFLNEMILLVNNNPHVIVNIVGIEANSDYAKKYTHEQIVYHGLLNQYQLDQLENEIDIYVEGFPMPSFMSLLKPALKRIPFQLHYNPLFVYRLFNDDISAQIIYPKNRDQWRKNIDKLINDISYRNLVRQKQFDSVNKSYHLSNWKLKLDDLYNVSKSIIHTIKEINQEVYKDSIDEQKIVLLDNGVFIHHFKYTEKMNFFNKLLIYRLSLNKHTRISYNLNSGIKYYLMNKDTKFY